MLIGCLIGFGILVVSWLVLPDKRDEAEKTPKAAPSLAVELLQPSQAH